MEKGEGWMDVIGVSVYVRFVKGLPRVRLTRELTRVNSLVR